MPRRASPPIRARRGIATACWRNPRFLRPPAAPLRCDTSGAKGRPSCARGVEPPRNAHAKAAATSVRDPALARPFRAPSSNARPTGPTTPSIARRRKALRLGPSSTPYESSSRLHAGSWPPCSETPCAADACACARAAPTVLSSPSKRSSAQRTNRHASSACCASCSAMRARSCRASVHYSRGRVKSRGRYRICRLRPGDPCPDL